MTLLALGLSACVATPRGADDPFITSYDSLKRAQDACAASGGALTLRAGGDPQNVADFACKRT